MKTETHTPTPYTDFSVEFIGQPWRNRKFKVRGICKCDVLNPCWDNRPGDVAGQHWSGLGPACDPCTKESLKLAGAE